MKKAFLSILFFFCIGFCLAQITIKKDYVRSGTRIVEIEIDGLDYSLWLNSPDPTGEAKLIFKKLTGNKELDLRLRTRSSNVLQLKYNNVLLLEANRSGQRLDFVEYENELDNESITDINRFASTMEELDPDWPGDDGIEAQTWRALTLTGGGTQSLAVARCNQVFSEMDEEGCTGTTDCYCMSGSFLCVCVCGWLCDY